MARLHDLEFTALRLYQIENAPVDAGTPWGPCLLAPGPDGGWTVGEWDGEAWCSATGFLITPEYYAQLPLILVRR